MKTSKPRAYRHALRTILAGAACSSIALTALVPGTALAAPEGKPKKVQFSVGVGGGTIRVISEDGEKWTRIKPDTSIAFQATTMIDMKWPGKIRQYGIFLGQCSGHGCLQSWEHPLMFSDNMGGSKFISKLEIFDFPTAKIPDNVLKTHETHALPPPLHSGYHIISKCNAALSQGKTIHDTHSFFAQIPITLGFDTYIGKDKGFVEAWSGDGPKKLYDVDHSRTTSVGVPVVCEPLPKPEESKPPLELLAADLSVSHVNYKGACPVDVVVSWWASTNVSGQLEAQIEAKSGGKSEKFTFKTTKENAIGTWSKSAKWKLRVPAASQPGGGGGAGGAGAAAGGGLEALPKPEDPIIPGGGGGVPQIDPKVVTGYNPPNLHEDSLKLVVTGNGKTITTPWRKYKVVCDPAKNPAVGKGPSSVVDTGKPHTANPDKQVVAPVPPITCLGGKVKDGKCLCDGETVVIGGLTSGKPTKFRCVAKLKPEVVKPSTIAPLPKITCAGGKISKGECVCGKGLKPVKAGAHAYRCIKSEVPTATVKPLVAPTVACKGGKVQANRCVCPRGTSLKAGECKAESKKAGGKKADSKKAGGKKAESKAVQSNTNSLKRRTR